MRLILLASITIFLGLTACEVNKRDPQTPAPTIKRVKIDFFFEFNEDRTSFKSRRFLFGISTEDRVGRHRSWAPMDHFNRYGYGSSNIEFEFNQEGTKLLGKLVNPTYPNDKDKWQLLVTFNVSRSYYEENRVDSTGRTSDDRIQRTDRSDPLARPYIDLELSSMKFENNVLIGFYAALGLQQIQNVNDVEWSADGKFLGFTTVSTNVALGSNAQSIDRVNFLRMDEAPADFVPTAYNKLNDQHVNILFTLGSRPNHYGEELKAVHWDINERTKKKHKIYLHNFPADYLQIAVDSVNEWNDVFEEMVGYRPFETEVWEADYHFDLRKHVIHWVDDIRLSAAGPLGVANIAADVETGRVLWSGSIVWGGLLDRYAGRNIPSSSVTGFQAFAEQRHDMRGLISQNHSAWSTPLVRRPINNTFFGDFTSYLTGHVTGINSDIIQHRIAEYNAAIDRAVESGTYTGTDSEADKANFAAQAGNPEDLFTSQQMLNTLDEALRMNPVNDASLDEAYVALGDNPYTFDNMLEELDMLPQDQNSDIPVYMGMMDPESDFFSTLPQNIQDRAHQVHNGFFEYTHDGGYTAYQALESLNSGISELLGAGQIVDIEEVKRGMIKGTLVHEFGHTLGLGHNFMGNILPKKGTLPNAIFEDLHAKATEIRTDSAGNHKEKMINSTSIMDYADGLTDALTPYEDHKPGINDIQRIRMLYKQEYPMYDMSSHGESDYVWVGLESDGRILPQKTIDGKVLRPGFTASCNDIEASFYTSPYCNRHDRGYDARTLMSSYFERYWDVLQSLLESKIDSLQSRNYQALEGYLWYYSSRTMNRGRLFHDYMRNKYRDEIASMNVGGTETYHNILEFSQSCRDLNGKSSDELESRNSQTKYSRFIEQDVSGNYKLNEFGDLCNATATYFNQLHELLQLAGKEYTEIDYFNTLVPGGIRSGDAVSDYSQMFGSWKRMSLLPIKFKIIQNMILPYPTMTLGGRDYGIYIYSRPDTKFSMSTLYPKEYLKVLRAYVESTVNIEDSESEPSISQSLWYLGYFLRFQSMTRDYEYFDREIVDSVSQLTKFRFSMALIQLDATKEDGSPYAKSFKGSIYNMYNNNGRETLGNTYLYTFDRFVMNAQNNNSLALQLSPVRWRTPSAGFSYAIKLDYSPNYHFEELEVYSPRKFFTDKYSDTLEKCVKGDNAALDNGLESYFNTNNENFEGILIPLNIDSRPSAYREVNDSIVTNLNRFAEAKDFDLRNCETALKTQTVLVLSAAMMMGYVFPETMKYYETGAN